MPKNSYNGYHKEYPFSLLGILTHAAPSGDKLFYAYHEKGFELHSLRIEKVSRLYILVNNDDKVENWADEQIWDELEMRLGDNKGFKLNRGEIFEKAITPMRGFMIDNMQQGKLFFASDAAHIVPPSGVKGLNLAKGDIRFLSASLSYWYKNKKKITCSNLIPSIV